MLAAFSIIRIVGLVLIIIGSFMLWGALFVNTAADARTIIVIIGGSVCFLAGTVMLVGGEIIFAIRKSSANKKSLPSVDSLGGEDQEWVKERGR